MSVVSLATIRLLVSVMFVFQKQIFVAAVSCKSHRRYTQARKGTLESIES